MWLYIVNPILKYGRIDGFPCFEGFRNIYQLCGKISGRVCSLKTIQKLPVVQFADAIYTCEVMNTIEDFHKWSSTLYE